MAGTKFGFRWWYLLLLLPLLLYGVAHRYVGYRIDQTIARANDDGNTLSVADYQYGFFPIALTAHNVEFDQQRPSFSTRGRLSRLEVTGLRAWSLISGDPIRLRGIGLGGLEMSLTRHNSPPDDDGSQLALEIEEFKLDSTFIEIFDEVNGQQFKIARADLGVQALALPFQPAGIRALRLAADTISFSRTSDATSVALHGIDYTLDNESITARELSVRRGDSTNVLITQLTLSGLNARNLKDGISIDSITAARVAGGARVRADTRRGEPAQSSPAKPSELLLQLGKINFPEVDLSVAGDFGSVVFDGSVTASDLVYADSLTVALLAVGGREVEFRRPGASGLAIRASGAVVRQRDLKYPLEAEGLGETSIGLPNLTVETGELTVEAVAIDYTSSERRLEVAEVQLSGQQINGTVAGVRVDDLDRSAMLNGAPGRAASVTLSDTDLQISAENGGSYHVISPRMVLTDIEQLTGLKVARAQLENGRITQRRPDGSNVIVATGVYLDQYGITTPLRASNLGTSKIRAARVELFGADEPVDYLLSKLRYDSRRGVLQLDSIKRNNQYTADELFQQKIGKSWLDFVFTKLRISGIDHDRLLRGETVQVDSLVAESLQLAVVEDLSLDLPPKDKLMPIEALRTIGPRIIVGNALFSTADISYGVVDSVLQPKTIRFGGGTISLTDLDTKLSLTDSVYATFDATFEETTPLRAEFVLSRDSSGRNYAVRGHFGRYDLSGINPLFEVAANAIVQSGVIDSMSYSGGLRNDTLTGEFNLLYHDLDLKIVGSGGFLKNLISGLVMKEENVMGEEFRQGKMYHEHARDKSFFNAYWKGLVSGMKSSALSDLALKKELD